MILLRVAQLAVAVSAFDGAFVTVSSPRNVVKLQTPPILFTTVNTPWMVAAQAFQGSLFAQLALKSVFHLFAFL
jgi:hypothetical protein